VKAARRDQVRADRWQDRFDRWVLAAAIIAIVGVALQTASKHGPIHLVGLIAVTVTWLIFVVDAAVMLTISPQPAKWARGHAFELVLLVLTFPLWPLLLNRLVLLELLPAFAVFEVAKLAKLAKVTFALRRDRRRSPTGRVARAGVIAAALGAALFVVLHN
jgi:hypothetical protein